MKKRLTLIGTKEFADQIIGFANRTGEFEFVGYFDEIEPTGNIINGFPVLGKVDDAVKLYQEGVFDSIFIAVGYTRFDLRELFYDKLKGKVPFANIIDKTVLLEKNVKMGEGVYIGPNTVIGENSVIGDNVFIHGGTVIAHDNKISNHTYISGRVDTAGFCSIGECNFVGIKALFADHVSTCENVWIGIGCIVAKNIKEPGKYMSSAAKLYKIE